MLLEYRIVEVEESREDFEAEVNFYLEEGWTLNGGHQVHVVISDDGDPDPFSRTIGSQCFYSQSMTRRASKPQLMESK